MAGDRLPATPIRLIEPGSYHGFIPTNVKDPVQTETDPKKRLALMLHALTANAEHPWVLLLDNLESIQDLSTLAELATRDRTGGERR